MSIINEHFEIAVNALKQISNPVAAMIAELKEGELLNGAQAYLLSNDPEYLKSIADKALEQIGESE